MYICIYPGALTKPCFVSSGGWLRWEPLPAFNRMSSWRHCISPLVFYFGRQAGPPQSSSKELRIMAVVALHGHCMLLGGRMLSHHSSFK